MSALTPKDINAPVGTVVADGKADVKSMEYHRQMLQNKMAREEYGVTSSQRESQSLIFLCRSSTYISPSDNIMSPCTAKLTALRNKQIGKYVHTSSAPHRTTNTDLYPPGSNPSLSSPRPLPRSWRAPTSSA